MKDETKTAGTTEDYARRDRAFFEATPAGVLVFDPHGRLLEVNPAVCEMYGYSEDEMLAMNPREFIAPESHHIFEAFLNAVSKAQPFAAEARDRRRDGSNFDIEVRGQLIAIGDQHYYFASLTDITEKLRAEKRVSYDAKFRALVSDLSSTLLETHEDEMDEAIEYALSQVGAFYDIDAAGLIWFEPPDRTVVTNRWAVESLAQKVADFPRLLPLEQTAWITKRILNNEVVRIESPNDYPPEAELHRSLNERSGLHSLIHLPLKVDGILTGSLVAASANRTRNWSDRIAVELQVLGEIIASAYSRLLALRWLREREGELARSQRQAGVGSYVYYPKENIYEASPELDAIFGLPPGAERTPEAWMSQILADDRDSFIRVVQRVLERESSYVDDFRFVRADGTLGVCQSRWDVERDENGNAERVLGTILDITDHREIENKLKAALEELEIFQKQIENENHYLVEEVKLAHGFDRIIGESPALRQCLELIERVAPTNATVLILGETGTGKELIAQSVHELSGREGPLVSVNCAALPPNLMESELFGHEKGAFTGAHARKPGRLELAARGTLFLDEIGELPPDLQAKLLRVLQEREFERVGGNETLKFTGRVVCATNRDLEEASRDGEFRSDLFFRLNVFPIVVPPLRERREDIPLLAEHLVAKRAAGLGRMIQSISKHMLEHLVERDWPGNIRELDSLLQRQLILGEGSVLEFVDSRGPRPAVDSASHEDEAQHLAVIERNHIVRVLEQANWQVQGEDGAARRLGLVPSTLRSRMAKLGIRRNP